MAIFAISDLHADNRANRELIQSISTTRYQTDHLIVAGDISNRLDVIRPTLQALKQRFRSVFFVPGNHEMWVSKDDDDSIRKFEQILAVCADLGIFTSPALVDGAWVVPLFSWYEASFYPAGDPQATELKGWSDFHLCNWHTRPDPLDYFTTLNTPHIKSYDRPVISFSHFVPRLELIPDPSVLFFKSLPLVSGSSQIEAQIRQLGSRVHVFGHTHINRDVILDGVRYVQNALRYPRERQMYRFENQINLVQVWD